ncbi:hypothetical protein FRC09_016939, partial [Ceratobasidium sp. 395]
EEEPVVEEAVSEEPSVATGPGSEDAEGEGEGGSGFRSEGEAEVEVAEPEVEAEVVEPEVEVVEPETEAVELESEVIDNAGDSALGTPIEELAQDDLVGGVPVHSDAPETEAKPDIEVEVPETNKVEDTHKEASAGNVDVAGEIPDEL